MEEDIVKTCVLLPAFNEANTIAGLIHKIGGMGFDAVVIDDGSRDTTADRAKREGAHVISHPKRRGKGAALRDGFDYARRNAYDIIITMDADGQHDPAQIPDFIKKARASGASAVIGNRLTDPEQMPLTRLLTNRFMSAVISAICRQKIPDTQCGFRLFMTSAISGIEIEAYKFEIESEILIKLAREEHRLESIPVKSIYAGETSQINPIIDTFRFIRFLIKILSEA